MHAEGGHVGWSAGLGTMRFLQVAQAPILERAKARRKYCYNNNAQRNTACGVVPPHDDVENEERKHEQQPCVPVASDSNCFVTVLTTVVLISKKRKPLPAFYRNS